MARTLEEKGTVGANLLSNIGTSNGCTVRGGVHGVVVVGDLLGRHGSGSSKRADKRGNWMMQSII